MSYNKTDYLNDIHHQNNCFGDKDVIINIDYTNLEFRKIEFDPEELYQNKGLYLLEKTREYLSELGLNLLDTISLFKIIELLKKQSI